MKVAIVFFGLIALALSQCTLEEKLFGVFGNNNTLKYTYTFGTPVGDWIPLVQYEHATDLSWFMTVQKINSVRYEVIDRAAAGANNNDGCPHDIVGSYNLMWDSACTTLTLTLLSDECAIRANSFTKDSVLNVVPPTDSDKCFPLRDAKFSESEESPYLGGETVSIVKGVNKQYIISVGSVGAFWQLWDLEEAQTRQGAFTMHDLGSAPSGFECRGDFEGSYTLQLSNATGCPAIICGTSDACPERASLFKNGLKFNGYSGDNCPSEVEYQEFGVTACSGRAEGAWDRQPSECFRQFDGNQCMFCHGIAGGREVRQCLDRRGGVCNTIFQSSIAKQYCNLEFECSSSSLTISFVFVVVSFVFISFLF